MNSGIGVLSDLFNSAAASAPAKTPSNKKENLSSKLTLADLSPEEVVTSPNFVLVEGVLTGAVTVTPKMAELWLTRNTKNIRKLREVSTIKYSEAMRKDQWDFNGESIKFDESGNLVDGQTRLSACILANKPFVTAVQYGVKSAINIDVGQSRTLEQLLASRGVTDSVSIAAAINYIHNYSDKGSTGFVTVGHGRHVLTREDALNFAEDNIDELIHSAEATKKSRSLFNKHGLHTALHFLFSRVSGQALADAFYADLQSGAGLASTSPILHLRERLTAERARKYNKMILNAYAGTIIKGWNYYICKTVVSRFQYDYAKEKVPSIKRSPLSK
jgi:hypothetical protein